MPETTLWSECRQLANHGSNAGALLSDVRERAV